MTAIRLARPSDLSAVQEIAEAAYARYIERIGPRPAPMDDDYAARVADGAVHVACVAGAGETGAGEADAGGSEAIVGFIVTAVHPDHLELSTVAVAPQQQGRGIGRQLIACAEDLADRYGLQEVRLYTNEAIWENLELYPRLGYRETGRRNTHGFDRVHFAKRVDSSGDTPRISN
ncbi:GNAT family N-acetyltransferase [Brevibacterium otitidis]|uniref:GNAT family N-acetyltransferase n=1 Tax=Brevibacterium otitidis TaxID=53364 RepID=A0ABV5WXP6_9MICO|nr:GNAT family N-acetyltransferase [Brevibacterium otitidis]